MRVGEGSIWLLPPLWPPFSCYLAPQQMGRSCHIRLMTEADLPAAVALKEAAGWNQTEADWRRLLRLQPEGCFVLETEGQVAASATAYCYGQELAWIGMVLTLPDFRGRGFGSLVFQAAVDFCVARGVRCVKLDATEMGQPLYQRAGFVGEYQVQRWGSSTPLRAAPARAPVSAPAAPQPAGMADSTELTEARLQALLGADARAFGASRAQLLGALWRGAEAAGCVERHGLPVAYALQRRGTKAHYFGPCVAEDAAAARMLLEACLARHAGQAVFVDVPAPNAAARRLLQDCGLEVRRTLLRMCRGPNDHPGDPARIFGLAGFEYG